MHIGKITENGLKILKEKDYFRKNESTWEDICDRTYQEDDLYGDTYPIYLCENCFNELW